MSDQCLITFWNKCEEHLKHYIRLFNIDMSSKGFHVQYKVLDRSPLGICYTLNMTYQEYSEDRADVLFPYMNISREIVFSLRQLLRAIQD